MKTQGGVDNLYIFFNLNARLWWVVNATLGRSGPGKETRYKFYKRVGGRQGPSGPVQEISHSPGLDSRTVQPVTRYYTDYASPTHWLYMWENDIKMIIN
jgi:hypothetical protein